MNFNLRTVLHAHIINPPQQ